MKSHRIASLAWVVLALLLLSGFCSAQAQTESIFNYPDFSNSSLAANAPYTLSLVGNASYLNNRLRLTPATGFQDGAAWFGAQLYVQGGFDSTFQFQITDLGSSPGFTPGADGIAFVIQDDPAGTSALGGYGGEIGYGGITHSLAVEFDTYQNSYFVPPDPNNNHIAIHTHGIGVNSANGQNGTLILGDNPNLPVRMADGNVHTAEIKYLPGAPGNMTVSIDGVQVLSVPVDLQQALGLPGGMAWVGLTSGTGAAWENHDILSWNYRTSLFHIGNVSVIVNATGTSAQITWTTDEPSTGSVVLEPNGPSFSDTTMEINHSVTIPTIPNQVYHFHVLAQNPTLGTTQSASSVFVTGTASALQLSYANLQKNADGTYSVTIQVTNVGPTPVNGVSLTMAQLGAAGSPLSPSLPTAAMSLNSAQSTSFTFTFPSSAGQSGQTVRLSVGGNQNSGAFQQSWRVVLP
ncbi:Legume lectin domain [Chthonomonas calidirosea]|uniref:L-type lectin-domain containing protein n=1 Tax=Chthonomonas calidirosea TaxID=454171 RepID=UPI0006DD39C1|nr:L-type lectin-domain containing protein [Chthonomonas calidirosea]CEK15804.1 Legume lectin domain [Chthonomonas calidirosea]